MAFRAKRIVEVYGEREQSPEERLKDKDKRRAAYHRFYIDEAYQFVTHRIIFGCISRPIAWFDRHVVDGFMNLLARTTQSAALGIRFMQSGSVQRYCIWFFAGTLGLTLLLLILR